MSSTNDRWVSCLGAVVFTLVGGQSCAPVEPALSRGDFALEAQCGDDADDDTDGLFDCADPDCAGEPACADAIDCDGGPLLVSGGGVRLGRLDAATVPFTVEIISELGGLIGGAGYNTRDGFGYGVRNADSHLMRLDRAGATTLGPIGTLPEATYVGGAVDAEGNLWLLSADFETFARVSLRTRAAEPLPTDGFQGGDLVYSRDLHALLAVHDNRLFTHAITSGRTSVKPLSGDSQANGFAAQWLDADGMLYAQHTQTGRIHRVDPETGESRYVGTAMVRERNDGASCALAAPPFEICGNGGDDDGDGRTNEDGSTDPDDTCIEPRDTDRDGRANVLDDDDDDDGVLDALDNCRTVPNQQLDGDGDGVGDACDDDADDDGIPDGYGLQGGGCRAGAGTRPGGLVVVLLVLAVAFRRRIGGALGLVLVAALATAPGASAQTIESGFPVERFRLSTDRNGILDTEWAGIPEHLWLDVSAWVGSSKDPLNFYTEDAAGERERVGGLVSSRLGGEIVIALALFERLQLTAALPVVLGQSKQIDIPGLASGTDLSSTGIGDVRLAPKVGLLRQANAGLDVAIMVGVTLPTRTSDDFAGEDDPAVEPSLLVSRSFAVGLRMALNGGYRFRSQTRALDLTVDDEIFGSVGLGFRVGDVGGPPIQLDASLAAAGAAADVGGAFNETYVEAKGGMIVDIDGPLSLFAVGGVGLAEGYGSPDWRIVGGLRLTQSIAGEPPPPEAVTQVIVAEDEPQDTDGDGLLDFEDDCPTQPETQNGYDDNDGCPDEVPDTDGDGLRDPDDACPEAAEDIDGFEDDDGCPDSDNDQDGLSDVTDRCPLEPGPLATSGCPDPDRDGDTVVDRLDNCPDEAGKPELQGCNTKQLVVIRDTRLEILDIVYFRTGKAAIQKRSNRLLNQVAAVISVHPEIKRIRVQGHTDDRGGDDFNLELSQKRAEAVVTYLVKRGVEAARLSAQGFGEAQPIEDNTSAEGRAANRRVEFELVDAGPQVEIKQVAPGQEPAAPGGDSNQAAPGGDSNQAAPGGDSNQAAPGGDSNHAAPGGDSNQAAPGGDSNQAAPGGDSNQAAPGGDSNQAAPGGDSNQAAPGSDSNQAAPGGDSNQAAPGGDSNQAAPGGDSNQ